LKLKDINLIIKYLKDQLNNLPDTIGMIEQYKIEVQTKKEELEYLIQILENSEMI